VFASSPVNGGGKAFTLDFPAKCSYFVLSIRWPGNGRRKGLCVAFTNEGRGRGGGGSAKRENDCSAIFKPQDVVFGRNSRRENRHSVPKTEGKGEEVARNVTSIIEQLLEKE
jgi:hypothetical protein